MIRRLSLLLSILVAPLAAQASELRTLLTFDGHPAESALFSVVGHHGIESDPARRREGDGSLRLDFAPGDQYPGLRVTKPTLGGRGFTTLEVEIFNPAETEVETWIRLDDAESRTEDERARIRHRFPSGWTTLAIDLTDVRAQSGRRLDPDALSWFLVYADRPTRPGSLVLDHLRLRRPAGASAGAVQALKAFETRFGFDLPFAERKALLEALAEHDDPRVAAAIGTRVLRAESDARLVHEALRVLAEYRMDATVDLMIDAAGKAKEAERWRWLEALGRCLHPKARRHAFALVSAEDAPPTDGCAVLRGLPLPGDAALSALLESGRTGAWPLRSARVRALRSIGRVAGPTLAGYVADESARVAGDAQEALVRWTGRDLGDDAQAWRDYLAATAKDAASSNDGATRKSRYGTYFGLPLVPGRIAFVLDMSGSMAAPLEASQAAYVERARHLAGTKIRTRFELAVAELRHAIASLPDGTAVMLVSFDNDVFVHPRGGARALSRTTRDALERRIRSLSPGGTTDLHRALVRAFEPEPDAPFRVSYRDSVDTIYVLSDGEPSVGAIVDAGHLVHDITERNRVRNIRIDTIGLGRRNSSLLDLLASRNGGRFVDLAP